VTGQPEQLAENTGIAFQGCVVLGTGFILESEEAQAWIAQDPRNAEVLFPYLNGEDLNSRPDCSASRWVIDFNERSQEVARQYKLPWQHAFNEVRPERVVKDAEKYPRMVNEWWKYWNSRPAMRKAIADLNEVLVLARVSKTLIPVRVSKDCVFDDKLVVFAINSPASQGLLSSFFHQVWAIRYGTTMRSDPTYTPQAVFETFPRPEPTPELETIGRTLDTERREIMLRRDLGLTKLYNLVNDPGLEAGIDPDVKLLATETIEPIQTLKTKHLGSRNPRLHTDEVLIALSVSATHSDFARRALAELHNIRGCDVHSTVILGPVDEAILRSLGAYVTCEPVFQTKRLYRKH